MKCNRAPIILEGGQLKRSSPICEYGPWQLYQEKGIWKGRWEVPLSLGWEALSKVFWLLMKEKWAQSTSWITWKCTLWNSPTSQEYQTHKAQSFQWSSCHIGQKLLAAWYGLLIGTGKYILACQAWRQIEDVLLTFLHDRWDSSYLTLAKFNGLSHGDSS